MKRTKLPIMFMAAAFAMPTFGVADDDDDELEYEEAFLYFELNDTDGDLGLHGKVDGDGWKKVKIESPDERKILQLKVKSGLKRQGMTELFFESSEPTFDELDPDDFFDRFPEGVYEWEGKTLDKEEIEGEVFLSHIIPAAPVVESVDGLTENPGFVIEMEDGEEELVKACWEADRDDNGGVLISWYPVTTSHYDMWNSDLEHQPLLPGEDLRYGEEDQPERKIPLGISGYPGEVLYYEFVAEIDDTDYKMTAVVPPGTAEWKIPGDFIELADDEVKFEIIVRVETGDGTDDDGDLVESKPGNQSAVEDCFEIEI